MWNDFESSDSSSSRHVSTKRTTLIKNLKKKNIPVIPEVRKHIWHDCVEERHNFFLFLATVDDIKKWSNKFRKNDKGLDAVLSCVNVIRHWLVIFTRYSHFWKQWKTRFSNYLCHIKVSHSIVIAPIGQSFSHKSTCYIFSCLVEFFKHLDTIPKSIDKVIDLGLTRKSAHHWKSTNLLDPWHYHLDPWCQSVGRAWQRDSVWAKSFALRRLLLSHCS